MIISDGHDFGSIKSLDQAIQKAQASDVIVFAIQYVAPGFAASVYSDAGRGPTALARLTAETGGSFFQVRSELDLARIGG